MIGLARSNGSGLRRDVFAVRFPHSSWKMTSMGKTLASLIALIASLFAALQIHAQTPAGPLASDTARVIVKLKADSPLLLTQPVPAAAQPATRAKALAQRLGLAMSAGAAVSERTQVIYASGVSSATLAQHLALEDDIEYAVPDTRKRIVTAPNDPLYANGVPGNGPAVGQWYLRAPTGAVQSSLNIETAWNVTQGNPSVVVAVVDTGVRYDHPDLLAVAAGGKLLPGYDMISDTIVANDGDGRDADASDPGDWVTAAEANDPSGPFYKCTTLDPSTGMYVAENSSWHGTQVSGLIAAITNNGIGMASVGPNLQVLPVRVLGKCGGYDSDIIAGMRWAAGLSVPGVPANPTPARVINLSLGRASACDSAYADAVDEIAAAGVVIVAAAGNSDGSAVGSPANCSGVIAVAGLRQVGTKVGFSSLGPEVALSAPGGNCVNTAPGSPCLYPLLTTSNSGTTIPIGPIYTDSYNPSLGTSFSSPLVAGTAALILSVQPSLTPQQVRVMLQSTARPFPTASDDAGVLQCTAPQYDSSGNPIAQDECICNIDTCGAGMLNAGAAVTAAALGTVGSEPPIATAVEYYYAAWNFYFVTSFPAEIAALDGGAFGGAWQRTGQIFSVWSQSNAMSRPTCRFFSTPTAFGGKSSHFYTPFPAECQDLQTNPALSNVWQLETPAAFYVALTDASGNCSTAGTVPLYRAYNNGMGGAPNHRYTTDPTLQAMMISMEWVAEGNGPNVIFACVPQD